MIRLMALLTMLLLAAPVLAGGTSRPKELRDLFFGEALFHAYQEDWFAAVARLDVELEQFYGLDEPALDSLYFHLDHAEFAVGDFELAYRMHHRAGRAISAVIEGDVEEPVRNEAIFRLGRLHFRKDQPAEAQAAVERIRGAVPATIRDDLSFLRAQISLATGRFAEAARLFDELQGVRPLEGFAAYNLGIARLRQGLEAEGRGHLDRTGQLRSDDPATLAIVDKANLVLGYKLLEDDRLETAGRTLDRVRLTGPFSNRALLGAGWAEAKLGRYERALVPWSLLAEREVTDPAVQEARLAVPYAYGKLNRHGRAALLYGDALEAFSRETGKLDASIKSIREGKFLRALVREELKQDANWAVKLRNLPETPETLYLLELMAAHGFQESLKNYLDLEQLRRKLEIWQGDLRAFEELIGRRRAYYEPLLPEMDREFRRLDSLMRLRLEQRNRLEKRLEAMLVAPRPEHLATAGERALREQLAQLEQASDQVGAAQSPEIGQRIRRLQGWLQWRIHTEYERRLTDTYRHLQELNGDIELLQKHYTAFVRARQAATQSCEGYDEPVRRLRLRIAAAADQVKVLTARQGHLLEVLAVDELVSRRERLAEFQVRARFALADSYDRATRSQTEEKVEP